MEIARNILLLLHLAGMAGILVSLLQSRSKLSAGVTHSALLALTAGIALIGIRYPLHNSDPMKWPLPDNAKIGIKLLVVIAILVLGYRYNKKESLPSKIWTILAGLTLLNILIAVLV